MESNGKIAKLFTKYVDDRETLKTLVNHKLSQKTREERLSIKRRILDELAKDSQNKILSDDAFQLSTADFVVSDLQYCERMRFPQSNPEFMTVGDLDHEREKLLKMVAVIDEEKSFRAMAPQIKVFKNVVSFINRMDNIPDEFYQVDDEDITPRASKRPRPSASCSSVLRTVLTPESSDPTGITVVATSATAVRVAEVAEEQQIDEEEDN